MAAGQSSFNFDFHDGILNGKYSSLNMVSMLMEFEMQVQIHLVEQMVWQKKLLLKHPLMELIGMIMI